MPDFGLGVFVPHGRSIGGIKADVTVEEDERDEVTVTEHPVEQGAPIADHAFKRQEEVTIQAGWSSTKSGDLSAETGIYGMLLNWQASFQLFDLYTGKRRHKNMLITSLAVSTDSHKEYSLMATIACREVILTKTQQGLNAYNGDQANQTNPTSTGPSKDGGTQEPTSVGVAGSGTGNVTIGETGGTAATGTASGGVSVLSEGTGTPGELPPDASGVTIEDITINP
jgi:hypothetical protein